MILTMKVLYVTIISCVVIAFVTKRIDVNCYRMQHLNIVFLFALRDLRRSFCRRGSKFSVEHFPYQYLSGHSGRKQVRVKTMQGVGSGGRVVSGTDET